jgi:hypothetical protein
MERKSYKATVVLCCIILVVLSTGCTQPSLFVKPAVVPSSDPESGIIQWMDAMNRHDVPQLYHLAPSSLRSNISLEEFSLINQNNVYFSRNVSFVSYEILNKTVSSDIVDIRATLVTDHFPAGRDLEKNIPIFFHFTLIRENGEWKIWTAPF